MSQSWFLLRSGPTASALNMALDEALLESVAALGRPVLRFYGWTEPAATFGYFQRYLEVAGLTALRPLIRRPTGGGLVPHDADWTYSLAFPPRDPWYRLRAVESYRRVHEWIHAAFRALGVSTDLALTAHPGGPGQCFIGAEKFDLLWKGSKVAGAAQRRNRAGLLIQGSVQPRDSGPARADWEEAMLVQAPLAEKVNWIPLAVQGGLRARADALMGEKYSQPAFNARR
jgi:lipoate-protein ligase A